ncbi:MAG: hypothetical protein ACKVZJ_07155 [Phycisphaerales bacterium]
MSILLGWKSRLSRALRGGRILALAAGVALAGLISLPKASFAQDDSEDISMGMDGLGWSLRKSTIESMADVLKLTPEQRKTTLDLYGTYNGQAKDAAKKVMEFMQGMQPGMTGMPSKEDMKKLMEASENYSEYASGLETKFMDDFKATLTAEQTALWPKAERRKRLADAGTSGPMGGGTVDLVGVARSVMPDGKLPEEAAAAVEQYEQDMDAAVAPYLEWRKSFEKKMKEIGEEIGGKSMEEMQAYGMKMMKEASEKARPATEVNNRSLSKMASSLPENVRDRFQVAYYRAAYFQYVDQQGPQIDKAFDAAMKMDGITEEQKKSLAEIRRTHDADTLALYKPTAEARDKEMKEAASPEAMWGGQSMQELYQKGPAIAKATIEKVRKALTPELLAKLPAPFKTVEVKEPTFEE